MKPRRHALADYPDRRKNILLEDYTRPESQLKRTERKDLPTARSVTRITDDTLFTPLTIGKYEEVHGGLRNARRTTKRHLTGVQREGTERIVNLSFQHCKMR